MAFNCGVSFGACLVRITRLDSNGNVIAGSNSYVSDKPISIQVNPNNEAGNNFSVRNGCGCKIASRKNPDTFNFWELTLDMAAMEPTMQAFMLGATTITDTGDVVGVAFPASLECDEQSPAVAFEFWAENVTGSGLDGTGTSQTNENWGEGPYGDGPPNGADIAEGAWWATSDDLPTAECASQNVTSSS